MRDGEAAVFGITECLCGVHGMCVPFLLILLLASEDLVFFFFVVAR